ncbi:MAG: InlB B-repeat-containing protein, partial [Caldilineaceae bacterium]|nr:InlB B-repeat-containing protein [Caldilineaceae bacterium]
LPDAGWLFDHWAGDLSTGDWWDTAWSHRTTIWIDADEYPRTDKVIDAPVNFSQLLAELGESGPLSVDSLRVLEIDAAGAVIDAAVPFQFDPAPGFDASTNAAGTVVFMAAGTTPSNTVRRFHLYFDTEGGFTSATVAPQITLTDNVMDEGQAAIQVDAPNGSYFFQKDAGGFSSLVDINGNDWIDFHPTGGAAGEYRGVPNPVYPEGSLHPGVTNATSTILHAGPLKATVHTITDDGDWESIWEFYPSHATMTLRQAAHPYWFVYEGTPGGLLEPATDRVVRSNGAQTTAATSWSGDLVGPEWVYFADPNVDRSLFVAQHEEDDVGDSYFPLQDAMTVMGFGRFGTETRQEHLPYQVSMGLLDGTTFGPTADAIQSAYQPLTVTVGDAVTQGMGTSSANPVTLTMDDDKTVTAIFVDSTVVPQYTLSIAAGTGGAVSVTPDKPSYNAGETVTITATADQEYEFANWSGSTVGVGNPVVVTMNADKSVVANFVTGAPVIDLWYGDNQSFGQVGNPQHWINILGNVSDPDGIATFVYTLNGGPDVPLATGPDTRRLDQPGDFNIDIAIADLVNGANQVVIRAVDNENNETITPVTVNYTAGTVWPSPYTIDWSTAAAINDVAQVVDGEWFIGPDGVRTVQSGYDRVVAIGDLNWTDYEITVPMIVHGIDWPRISPHTGPPGLGLLMRWAGHTDDPIAGWQPKTGWVPHGEIAWWNWSNNSSATLVYFSGWPSANSTPAFDTPYIFKMRVESVNGGASRYSTKVWEQGQPEPANWFLERENDSSHLGTGSVMLLAHMVDASFGDVTINPITQSGHTLSVAPNGSGAVTVAPQKPSYEDDETVTLTASADPGWIFTGWSGDLTSSDNPLTLTMTGNVQLTANFVQSTSHTLTVNSSGGGSTTRSPDQPTYDTGSTVTLSATADPGWVFTGWSGDITGTANPVNVTVNANMSVIAEFAYQAAIVSDDFSACSLNTSLWNFSDPVGDGGYSFGNGRLELIVPGGSSHDVWDGGNNAVRVMQAASDSNFELEVKFESGVVDTYEMQGLLVEEDSGNFLRFDFYGTGANTAIFAARFDAGTPSIIYNGDVAGGNAAPLYMRIRRLGDQWTQFYSVDGQSWTQASSFTRAMTVNAVGIFAANSSNNPAHTAQVDYFFNRATPIAGEDSTIAQPTLTLTTDGTGAIAANPDQPLYTCGDQVTVSATPAAGWAFSGWSGAASGTENPLTIAMDGNKSIQATFTEIV